MLRGAMEPAADPPTSPYVMAFREGVSLQEEDGGATLSAAGRAVPLRRLSPGLARAMRRLSTGGASEAELLAEVLAGDTAASLPHLFVYLERFQELGLLTFSVKSAGSLLCTLEGIRGAAAHHSRILPVSPSPGERYTLSRFAHVRPHGGLLRLESPLAPGRVVLHDARALAVCQALAEPRTAGELARLFPEAPDVLGLFLGCGAAAPAGPEGQAESPALSMWSFHDLLFHTRSRRGRSDEPFGATYRFAGVMEPLPALAPAADAPRIELHRPDIEALKANDVPFTRVLEERASIRAHGEAPITARQLGEWLFRTARVRSLGTSTSGPAYATTSRPYPGGGACHELEVYLAVRACDGLAPGLYRHEPRGHALTVVSGPTKAVDALLSAARSAMLAPAPPQVLLVLSARFGRVMWKYESMAYATILKDVGVFYQTAYLVATAMGLACCAVGSGDSDLFASAAGLDYLAETSVGEMALGSRPA